MARWEHSRRQAGAGGSGMNFFVQLFRRVSGKNAGVPARPDIRGEKGGARDDDGRLAFAAAHDMAEVYAALGSGPSGLDGSQVEEARDLHGRNIVHRARVEPLYRRVAAAFINPFTLILLGIAGVSVVTDVLLAEEVERDFTTLCIILIMVFVSGLLRFVQEARSDSAAAELSDMIRTTASVLRKGSFREIPLEDVVVGDVIRLAAGDMIPADMRVSFAKDLFVSQSALTGESEPVEKFAGRQKDGVDVTPAASNLLFMGCNVVSGSAMGVALATGDDTMLGRLAQRMDVKPPPTAFEQGINSVSWVLIRFMLVMVPVVLFLNGFTKGDWTHALLFAVSVAVGLTPEMLPMIMTTCLARGAVVMAREKVIIRRLNAIQNLGSMDVLCTDKTGTLTRDRVELELHLNVEGREDLRVLRHAFLNSWFQTGLRNLMDRAVIEKVHELREDAALTDLHSSYVKVDEVPFDFERRRMSVVVSDRRGKTLMITKGAVEEMLRVCGYVEYAGAVEPLTDELRRRVRESVARLNERGMRVIAVAQKNGPAPQGEFSAEDERDMVLIGYLAFLDPPKESAAEAVAALGDRGVTVKVLTGDNERVTRSVCVMVGISSEPLLTGPEIDGMDDASLARAAEKTPVFARLTPDQKARVVEALRSSGHIVGCMGDGINDAAALRASDVGISVDTAVDFARESADVVLLQKDLRVLEKGIVEGRRTYANMVKYIKMTASSNFGNMLSVLVASAFLPFLPMQSIQLLLLNMVYDLSCTAIPWDNVDPEFVASPRKWEAASVSRFMLWFGPTSSVFDIFTYYILFFILCPAVCGGAYADLGPAGRDAFAALFQTGWFVESMWTQSLVIHMIRTPKMPFVQSRAALPLVLFGGLGIALVTLLPFTRAGGFLELVPLPGAYFGWLALVVASYMLLTLAVKRAYMRRYGALL